MSGTRRARPSGCCLTQYHFCGLRASRVLCGLPSERGDRVALATGENQNARCGMEPDGGVGGLPVAMPATNDPDRLDVVVEALSAGSVGLPASVLGGPDVSQAVIDRPRPRGLAIGATKDCEAVLMASGKVLRRGEASGTSTQTGSCRQQQQELGPSCLRALSTAPARNSMRRKRAGMTCGFR